MQQSQHNPNRAVEEELLCDADVFFRHENPWRRRLEHFAEERLGSRNVAAASRLRVNFPMCPDALQQVLADGGGRIDKDLSEGCITCRVSCDAPTVDMGSTKVV